MVPSARLGKEGGARNGARETAIYAPRVCVQPTRVPFSLSSPLRFLAPLPRSSWTGRGFREKPNQAISKRRKVRPSA